MKPEEADRLIALLSTRVSPASISGCAVSATVAPVFPEEEALAVSMAASRAREFLSGRAAAAKALELAGAPKGPVLRGESGEPIWPGAFCGSISHGAGIALAVAAPVTVFRSVGIDVETTGRLRRKLWKKVFTSAEAAALALEPCPGIVATAAFSAKEAVYKACHFASGRGPEMKAVSVAFAQDGAFEAVVDDAAAFSAPARINGFFLVAGAATVAFVAFPA
ncbi:MAG TPA: 4'-phosphopantetheinyl transferase superfamily protein [Opitutales bacterium]|nr:4'-phosphopantetheinyl transferase superfamily protein [Opitutales bacterium]